MDKKGSRSIQSSAKGITTDSKKNQDGAGGKLWPKGGRRREPAGGSFPAKNETSRKPAPQRNKTIDKRPKPRGNYYSGPLGGKEVARLEEEENPELGSVFVQGSKKQSLNHLLNFHYEPRESHWHSGKSVTSKSGHRWLTTIKHKYNKEQFLQANCQFIVKSSGNYQQYMNNPDTLVDWNLIEQVNVQVSEFPSCPICLYPPVAAKMTRCGHVYCWSCVLHYLALSDKTWRKCPICFESVHKQDLKSTVFVPHSGFNVNETITFKLMKRLRGSLIAYPVDQAMKVGENVMFNMSEKNAANIHCKLLLANKVEVMSIIERERRELDVQLAEDENCPEKCFIQEAVALLLQRENGIFNQNDLNVQLASSDEIFDRPDNLPSCVGKLEHLPSLEQSKFGGEGLLPIARDRVRFESVGSENLGSEDLDIINTAVALDDLEISNWGGQRQPTKCFYFYQASDGQHIYLHAVNARMLEHTYGSLEMAPKTITSRIVEKEGGSMTEELRKRLRYLQHLPVTCQFEVAEIQLSEPVVSKDTLRTFHEQIETRRKRRQRRAREEKRREKHIQEEENRKLGRYPMADIHLDSPLQFPEVGYEPQSLQRTESESTPYSERSLSPVSGNSGNTANNSLAGSLNTENESPGPSFAKMLSSAKKPTTPWPELKAEVSVPVTRLINVTGAKTTCTPTKVSKHSDSEHECEDYVPAPQFNRSFGDAIALALEKAATNTIIEKAKTPQSGKKKKNKQKVLFATSMAYCGN